MFKNISLKSLDINTEMRESLRLAHLGTFEGLDIDILKVNELSNQHSPCYVKGMFDSFNIKPGAWYLPLALSLSEPTLKKDIESLKPVLETAVSLEAVRSILLLPAGSDETPYEDFLSCLPEKLSYISEQLNLYNCRIGVELPATQQNVKQYKHNYGFLFNQLFSLLQKENLINIGIVFDSFSWYKEGSSLEILKQLTNTNLVYVKLSDSNISLEQNIPIQRTLPGLTNIINLALIMQTLKDIDYDGPITPISDEKRITSLPYDISAILSGGYLSLVWKKSLTEKSG